VANPWSELARPPLAPAALAAALVRPGAMWSQVRVVPQTGSTNADLLAAAGAGLADPAVLVAEAQTAGHGRLDREWVSPPRAGLTFSMLLRPGSDPTPVPVRRWGWLPLLTGLALLRAVQRLAEVESALKWPNDLLLGPGRRKAAGILVQASGDAVVVGVGLNVSTRSAELPRADATSLALEGAACTDRDPLLRAVLRQFEADYTGWRRHGGDPVGSGLHAAYQQVCDTLGRQVRAEVPNGEQLTGVATGLDLDGRLVLRTDAGERLVSAGDVVHLR
jgi:BirA family biotin operon repressor/biotin-[acetyl-CoA-carboxylase] ligase